MLSTVEPARAAQPEVLPASRAIVLTEVSELGGAERACLALSRWLFEAGVPNHLVTYVDTAGLAEAATHPVAVVQLRPRMRAFSKVAAMRRYLRSRREAPPALMSGYQPALHATLGGVRGFHCLMHDTPSLFGDALEQRSMRRRVSRRISDWVTGYGLRSGGQTIVTSDYLQQETERVFRVRASIARMGGLGSLQDFAERPARETLRLLSVSRLEANKRLDWVLRAMAAMERGPAPLSSRTDWRLDVTGRGSQMETLRALADSLGLAERVQFHGFVSDAELDRLYAEADLFLMPAVQGYGIPAIESLQRGLPVLLHRDSGVSDILLGTPWATVFEGGEEQMQVALPEAIASLLARRHHGVPLPELPSEASWAEQVARLCGWV